MERPLRTGGCWLLLGTLAAIALAISVWCPLGSRIEFGGDEGYELQKAALLERGFLPYREVWNDQSPLHTWVLSVAFRALGDQVLWGRLISLGAAVCVGLSVGIWARRVAGTCGAALAVAILFGNPLFFLLGTSAMLEMPAVAVALMAMNVAGARRLSGPLAALLAGALLGLAAQVKLTALLYTPACLCLLWLRLSDDFTRCQWRRVALAGAGFLVGSVVSFFAVAAVWPGELGGLLPHFGSRMRAAFAGDHAFHFQHLTEAPTIFLIATLLPITGVTGSWKRALPFVANAAITLAILCVHRPFWDYYLLRFVSRICGRIHLVLGAFLTWDTGQFPSRHRCESRRIVWSPLGFCC